EAKTLTATVAAVPPGAGTPTGTVDFFDGATLLGTGTLSGGVATFTTSALSVGSHLLTAVYSGDTNFTGSTSPVDTQTVNQAATTTALTSAPDPSVF
ncbi:Ig-like domain-containing protein, partial [Streptomyces scopuliridis]|uniref:Ig-like domain-containing protein n=1 Tax=Streptomyces scopuliridis TaxID=452529 RepID=UPI003680E4EC